MSEGDLEIEVYTVEIVRDARTRVAIVEEWSLAGKPHREGAPAVIMRNPETGRVYLSKWYDHGEQTKPPRPSNSSPKRSKPRRPAI